MSALERLALAAQDRPSWLTEPEFAAPASDFIPVYAQAAAPAAPIATVAEPEPEPLPAEFDDATDRFAQFAMRAAESRTSFAPAWDATPVRSTPLPVAPTETGTAETTEGSQAAGWRREDVHVSAADLDADAMRLEMLAMRAAETRATAPVLESEPAPAVADAAEEPASTWRRDMVVVDPDAFDADAARLESLAARASDVPASWQVSAPVVDDADEPIAFWRKEAVVIDADAFDADAARLESLAARGPLFAATEAEPVESTPFWEQQELARRALEERAQAERAAAEAVATDEWHAQWERVALEAARRGDTAEPLGTDQP